MYKVAFDLRTTHLTGIHRYGMSILAHIETMLCNTDLSLQVLYKADTQEQTFNRLNPVVSREHMEFIAVPSGNGFMRSSEWLRNWLTNNGIHLYYSVNYLVDELCPVQFVYTIHDLIRIKYPSSTYTDKDFQAKFGIAEYNQMKHALRNLAPYIPDGYSPRPEAEIFDTYFFAINRCLAERSKCIATVSSSVKEDITTYLAVCPSKIHIIPGAVNRNKFYPQQEHDIEAVLQRFNLPSCYCLYVGLGHKHKRISWLINILAKYRTELPQGAKLVIVGGHVDLYRDLYELISSLNLSNLIVFVGAVSDSELACLYSGAKALVIPSIDEGFCLPALEALVCGTEVIVPNTSVLREVVGASGHFYELEDENQLGKLVINAFHNSLTSKAASFRNPFSWENSAKELFQLLVAFYNGPKKLDSQKAKNKILTSYAKTT